MTKTDQNGNFVRNGFSRLGFLFVLTKNPTKHTNRHGQECVLAVTITGTQTIFSQYMHTDDPTSLVRAHLYIDVSTALSRYTRYTSRPSGFRLLATAVRSPLIVAPCLVGEPRLGTALTADLVMDEWPQTRHIMTDWYFP